MGWRGLVVVVSISLSMLAAGCSNSGSSGSSSSTSSGSMMGGAGSSTSDYSSVGKRIYLTGVGSGGGSITHSDPAVSRSSLIMMRSAGCGSCHDGNGRGGTIRKTNGTFIKAPDITHGALIRRGFTDAAIRKAITEGLDEKGKPLDGAMPRWQMSNADLDATIAYLIVLGTK